MSIEYCLAVNLLFDLAILGAATRALGVFSWRRLLPCAAMGSGYAALALAAPTPWASPPAQLLALAVTAAIASGTGGVRQWLEIALTLCVAAPLCAGLARLLCGRAGGPLCALPGIAAGVALLLALYALRPPRLSGWLIHLSLEYGRGRARFPALIDTGNRLREPLSGQPVLIAEEGLLKGLLPEAGFRTLRFGAVAGSGQMRCFKPDAVWIERGGRRTRAPEIWVAVSPGQLPGAFRALAPPEFADRIR